MLPLLKQIEYSDSLIPKRVIFEFCISNYLFVVNFEVEKFSKCLVKICLFEILLVSTENKLISGYFIPK